jgi:phosphatidate cytidylyltransferase
VTASNSAKWGDLAVRSASAIALIPMVIACVWLGGYWFLAFVAALGCLIGHEWTSIVHPGRSLQYVLHIASALSGALLTHFFGVGPAISVIFGLSLISGLMVRFSEGPKSTWSYLGILYTGFPIISLMVLRADPEYGFLAILWVFVIVWSADILAYFAGRIIGGPKLAPRISPKKTWAGLAGAVFGSAAASLVFFYFIHLGDGIVPTLFAGALALVEQAGDLFESSLKRHFGVKDSGRLIPGHGGVIDRVDGLIAATIVAAALGSYRGQGVSAAQGLLFW